VAFASPPVYQQGLNDHFPEDLWDAWAAFFCSLRVWIEGGGLLSLPISFLLVFTQNSVWCPSHMPHGFLALRLSNRGRERREGEVALQQNLWNETASMED